MVFSGRHEGMEFGGAILASHPLRVRRGLVLEAIGVCWRIAARGESASAVEGWNGAENSNQKAMKRRPRAACNDPSAHPERSVQCATGHPRIRAMPCKVQRLAWACVRVVAECSGAFLHGKYVVAACIGASRYWQYVEFQHFPPSTRGFSLFAKCRFVR